MNTANNQNSNLPPAEISLGHALRPYTMMSDDYVNVNNGSFGTCPTYVIQARDSYLDQLESKPDFFTNYTHPKLVQDRKQIIAKYMDADAEGLAFVRNATDAASCVLNSLSYESGDIILLFDIIYNAVRTLCKTLVDKFDIKIVEMPTTAEILNSKEKIVALIEDHIQQYGKKIKIAIIDYISSIPAVIIPVEEIIPIFKENGILCMIDAAHAFNQVDYSIRKLDPDFFHTNIHKWSPIPKSISVLYTKKELQDMIHPATLSCYKKGYSEEFMRPGNRDYSSVYCVKEAMEFVERIGRERMMEYCRNLALETGKKVVEMWGTELLVSDKERISAMVNVMLPYQGEDTLEKFEIIDILTKMKAYLAVFKYDKKYYIRFSCHIYNELSDFEELARLIKKHLCQ